MRLYFLLALAVLVLPLSGCAKKKADSDAVASNSNNFSDSEGMDDEGMDDGMEDDGMSEEDMENPGGHEEGMDDGMLEEGVEGDPMYEEGVEGDPMYEEGVEGDPMNEKGVEGDPMYEEGVEGDPMYEEGVEGDPMYEEGVEGDPMYEEGVEGDPMSEESVDGTTEGEFSPDGVEGGLGGGGVPAKPTDIPGVKEGTPEYAAVDLILKVSRGDTDALKSVIAEDVDGLLKKLRSDDPTKAIAEAKEMFGKVKPQSSRLDDRDTIVSFKNDKDKILQFYVRRIQGEYVVREIRVREAVDRTPTR